MANKRDTGLQIGQTVHRGSHFGAYEVISATFERGKKSARMWLCRCTGGCESNARLVDERDLRRGVRGCRSCVALLSQGRPQIVPGSRFGLWEVVSDSPPNKTLLARCLGCRAAPRKVSVANLKNGSSTRCRSCAVRERNLTSVRRSFSIPAGATRGGWIVVSESRKGYTCRCASCGKEKFIRNSEINKASSACIQCAALSRSPSMWTADGVVRIVQVARVTGCAVSTLLIWQRKGLNVEQMLRRAAKLKMSRDLGRKKTSGRK